MSRRGENIHKRKDGRWEARYKKGVSDSGTVRYGSVYAKTYREAKEKQREMLRIEETKNLVPQTCVCLEDILNLWLEDNRIRLKGATEFRYRYLIDSHILPELGNKRLDQITSPIINIFLANKLDHGRLDGKGGLSPAYVRSIMLILKAAINFATTQNLCKPLQTKINKPPKILKELPILHTEQQAKLVAYCMTDVDETKVGILISLYAGLRIGEICALRWDDIDLQEHVIHVRYTVSRAGKGTSLSIGRPKTLSSLRDIPICSQLVPILKKLHLQRSSQYVVSNKEKFISPRTYEYRYHSILRACSVPDINYHALRHTFATRCVEAGIDIKSLSEMLGHADASITLNTYVHSSMERKREQLEKLASPIA